MTRAMWKGLAGALLIAGALVAQRPEAADTLLQTALKKEVVDGNLSGAIEGYKKALAAAKGNRSLAAQALVHMAECYQKLGDAQSRTIYEQIVRDYGDQKEALATAQAHLGGAAANASISSHRVWTAVNAAGARVAVDFYGQVSPDGRYVPYTNWDDKGNLFAHDLVTGTERRLTNTAGDEPGGTGEFAEEVAFSRDGKQVAYTWNTKEGPELRMIGLQGDGSSQPRRLVVNRDLKWISPYSWSPDGKFIAVRIQRQDRGGQLGIVSIEGGSLRILKSVDWRSTNGPFFSPDGKYLAYDTPAGDATGQQDIFVLTADGSREIPAVVHPSRDSVVGWSPDGKRLLVASDRGGSMSLWALPFGDGKPQGPPELLKGDIGEIQIGSGVASGPERLGITTSGALYSAVYNPGADPSDIQFGAFDFATGRFLSTPTSAAHTFLGSNVWPVWSLDGKYLAYASMRRTHVAIGIRSIETGQIRELIPSPNFDASPGYFHSLAWAPDGNSFIVAARGDKDGNGVYRIDGQTGRVSFLVPASRTRWALESPDGKTLYYHAATDDDARILKRDLATGEEKELVRSKSTSGIAGLWLSPDGRFVGTVANDGPGSPARMILIPTAGGPSREVLSRPSLGAVIFSPDGRYVATGTVDQAAKARAILLVPVEGGEIRELMRVPDLRPLVVAAWSPDSRSILLKESSVSWDQSVLWRAPVDGNKPQKLDFNADHIGGGLLTSPDWRHVAFQTPQPERKPTEIWVTENLLPSIKAGKGGN
jgi:Tol biopolymer transport system component